jgi:hypothetical protein
MGIAGKLESLFMIEPAYQMGDVSALASPRF